MGGEGPTPYEVLLDAAMRGDLEQLRPPGRGRGDVARRPASARLAASRRGLRARHVGACVGGRADARLRRMEEPVAAVKERRDDCARDHARPRPTCIDTIRTLCIDAIEAANSGHPGTPVGIAPVTYTLWQRFLRFDPADPIWPNRDRFVLSAGHASALLWSLVASHRRPGRRPRVRDPRRAGRPARRPEAVPAARLEVPGPSRVPLDERRRDHLRPARPGRRHLGRHGGREPVARSALQPRRLHALRLRRLRAGGRRLHDGGRRLGGGLVRRAPAPLEPLLDLRLEPRHDRRATRTSRSPRTSPPASRRTAGTSRRSRTRTTSSRPSARSTPSRPRTSGRR